MRRTLRLRAKAARDVAAKAKRLAKQEADARAREERRLVRAELRRQRADAMITWLEEKQKRLKAMFRGPSATASEYNRSESSGIAWSSSSLNVPAVLSATQTTAVSARAAEAVGAPADSRI